MEAGDIFPGSVPKPEDTPPSSRFWMELEGGAEPRTGRREEAEPRQIKGRADKLQRVVVRREAAWWKVEGSSSFGNKVRKKKKADRWLSCSELVWWFVARFVRSGESGRAANEAERTCREFARHRRRVLASELGAILPRYGPNEQACRDGTEGRFFLYFFFLGFYLCESECGRPRL